MSSTSPQPDASSAPPAGTPTKRRNPWIWVSAGLALVAVGRLVWALSTQSDLDSAEGELDSAKQELASTNQEFETARQELGSTKQELDGTTQAAEPPPTPEEDESNAALVAAGALFSGLAWELGATQEEVAVTEQDLDETQKAAEQAEQDAAAAERQADDAIDYAAKAKAQTDQVNAEKDAAQARAAIAADCAKSYLSAFAELDRFHGSVRRRARRTRGLVGRVGG